MLNNIINYFFHISPNYIIIIIKLFFKKNKFIKKSPNSHVILNYISHVINCFYLNIMFSNILIILTPFLGGSHNQQILTIIQFRNKNL
jgi:hypothetical protein